MKKILFLIITIMAVSNINAKETPFELISNASGPYQSIFSPFLFSIKSINSIVSTLFSFK